MSEKYQQTPKMELLALLDDEDIKKAIVQILLEAILQVYGQEPFDY